MSIFEQYPRPWKLVEINVSDYMIQDANGYRVLPTPQIFTFAHGGTEFWEEVIECVNALGGIDFPEAWVNSMSDAIKGYKATIRAKDERIAELEQEADAVRKELDDQMKSKLQDISSAIHFFTGKTITDSDISDWSNGIDPTQPIDE